MKQTVGMIGAGNMGAAILAGIYKTYKVNVCEADKKRARKIKTKYKVNITDLEKTITSSDIILLAVKPQSFTVVLAAIKPYITKRHIVVSIAAGITCRYIEKALGQGVKVVRTMPNLPAQISQGITALAAGKNATRGDLKRTSDLLKSVGQTVIVDENMIDAVTAVSGSGPAYVFLFAELFIKSAKAV
ncbi:MAG: pyrroline-5-carboxylate reductase, partial [Candidatus Omnitrophota bacterium]